MGTYIYKAKKDVDKTVEGSIEALNPREAAAKIDSMGLFPISINENNAAQKSPKRVRLRDMVEFTHQLSTLVSSGSTLLNALVTLSSEVENNALKPIISDIITEIKEGRDFSQALARYPYIFSPLYVSLVKAAEISGTLDQNLKRLGEFLEEELDFRANIISILTYPLLIVAVGAATVFVLLKFVIPKLVDIFGEIGQALPIPTMILVNMSDLFSRYWFFIFVFFVIVFFAARAVMRRENYRFLADRFKLRMPLLGDLVRTIEISRFSRTLSMLLTNGLTLNHSLQVLSSTITNLFLRRKIETVKDRVTEGASFGESIRAARAFPKSFVNAVIVGEESACLEQVLDTVFCEYKKDIDRKIKRLLTILEPFLILSVGLVVGFIVLSMLLPIFDMDFNF